MGYRKITLSLKTTSAECKYSIQLVNKSFVFRSRIPPLPFSENLQTLMDTRDTAITQLMKDNFDRYVACQDAILDMYFRVRYIVLS